MGQPMANRSTHGFDDEEFVLQPFGATMWLPGT